MASKRCGTGATSCAALCYKNGWITENKIKVMSDGGQLEVHFLADGTCRLLGQPVILEQYKQLL